MDHPAPGHPPALTPRLVIGLVALAEVVGVLWVRRLSVSAYLASLDAVSGGVPVLLFLIFAAMPMLVERR